ncbi:unnamed protein product, partial [marine sediment metagenome]
MPYGEVTSKLVSELSGVSTTVIRGKNIPIEILQKILNCCSKISEYNLHYMGKEGPTVADIENELFILGGVDIVFVDYLQKILPSYGKCSRYEQITQISRDIKFLATKFNIPVIAVASINRAFVIRKSKRPQLSDFRDSGNVEYDIDVALLLYRKSQFEDVKEEEKQLAEIIIAKNRYGRS